MSRDLLMELALKPPRERQFVFDQLSTPHKIELAGRWYKFAHKGQFWPGDAWRVWLIRAGRGFGKTRAGAEWVSQKVRDIPGVRIALVGATFEEARRVMVEGPSGLLAVARLNEHPEWKPTRGEVRWPDGACATVYSADSPEGLRGPEHHIAWCDELAKWRRGDAAWDNLMMTMRLGDQPKVVVTTTPRPNALMKRVRNGPDVEENRGSKRVMTPASWCAPRAATRQWPISHPLLQALPARPALPAGSIGPAQPALPRSRR